MTDATVEQILCAARDLIKAGGWERNAWQQGVGPRCVRCAIFSAANDLDASYDIHGAALRRTSEAIYDKRGSVGGITDWEHHKRTTQDGVIAMLDKAIEMGPGEPTKIRIQLKPV